MRKLSSDMFVFVCAGTKNAPNNVPTADVLFFANSFEASDELQNCNACGWSVYYQGTDFKDALKTLTNLKEQGYKTDQKNFEDLGL